MVPWVPSSEASDLQLDHQDISLDSSDVPDLDLEKIPSDRTCSTELEASLVRGVPVHVVMNRFCQAFTSKTGTAQHYMRSRQTNRIDEFFSHDWDSARWYKAVTLYHYYNGRAASIMSLLTGIVLAILQTDAISVLPKPPPRDVMIGGEPLQAGCGIWCVYMCPVVFVIGLLNFHKLGTVLQKHPRLLFVDKFCIDQVDEERKTAGILGLAGFLRNSQKLVICWTPRYFTRLWCVFEIASWKYLGKPLNGVTLMPSSQVMLTLLMMITLCSYYVVHRSVVWLSGNWNVWILHGFALVCGIWSSVPATTSLVQNLSVLPKQLASFSSQESECFCCENNHVNPETGKHMQCDRKLIYATLVLWFATYRPDDNEQAVQKDVLRGFDDFIHNQFASWVLQSRGPTKIPYDQVLFATLPVGWAACDIIASYGTIPMHCWWRFVVCEYAVFWFLLLPSSIKVVLHMYVLLDKFSESATWSHSQQLWIALRYILIIVVLVGSWLLLVFCNWCESVAPVLTLDCLLVLLTASLYGFSMKLPLTLAKSQIASHCTAPEPQEV